MASAAEREMRDALVGRIHAELPGYRVIHELNADSFGPRRADLAVVGRSEIIIFEIKSRRDKLTRLAEQMRQFDAVAHHAFAVLDQKWFEEREARNAGYWLEMGAKLEEAAKPLGWVGRQNVWCWPDPAPHLATNHRWRLSGRDAGTEKRAARQPAAANLLELLWRAELREECAGLRRASASGRRASGTTTRWFPSRLAPAHLRAPRATRGATRRSGTAWRFR